MKKKIIIALGVICFLFTLCGIYIIVTVERATSKLDKLIKLHQVEILREHLLIHIKGVQSDLTLSGTRYASSVDTIVTHSIHMGKVADKCFTCHHSPEVLENLNDLKRMTENYKDALSRVLTLGAGSDRLETEKDRAIVTGQGLIEKVNSIVALTSRNLSSNTQVAFRQIALMKTMLFVLIAAGPVFSVIFAYVSIRGLARPMNELLTATRRLESGDLDYRIEGLKDEFGEVSASFNKMARSLKEQMLQMQRTEQMAVVGELAAGLGHEVKNPLAGIKAAVNLLSEELTLRNEDRILFSQIVDEVGRLETLMKNFLNFAKPPKPQWESVDLNEIIATTIDFYLKSNRSSPEGQNGIRIVKDLDDRIPLTMADPVQLQQVFLNLLLNSIDAMPGGGMFAVGTHYDVSGDSILIDITDTGKGIDPDMICKIFQPFFTTKSKGTGLGLAICRQLIGQHGGDITVGNNPAGGILVRIVLPRKTVEEEGKPG
ncbi:MAG: HAMP domain-containing protein [Deltaproteobacteria bacterium]|nr:HAMP domain-containing protein [Deltaproteobacteria bacterium]